MSDLTDTVKARLVSIITEHWPILDCNEETRQDRTTCACALHGATWQPTVEQSIKEWAEHLAEQIEPAIRDLMAQATADALKQAARHVPVRGVNCIYCRCGWRPDLTFDSGEFPVEWHDHIRALAPDIAAKAKERDEQIGQSVNELLNAIDDAADGQEAWLDYGPYSLILQRARSLRKVAGLE